MSEPRPAELMTPPEAVHDPRLRRTAFARSLATGGVWAEIFHELRVDASITVASSGRVVRSASFSRGVGLRVIGPAGSCQTFSSDNDTRSLLNLADLTAAGYGAMAGRPHAPAPLEAPSIHRAGANWADALDMALLEDQARAALAVAQAQATDGVRVRGTTWLRAVDVANTDGLVRGFVAPGSRLAVDAFARAGSDRRKGRANYCSAEPISALTDSQTEDVGRRAASQAQRLLGTGTIEPSALPVLFAAPAAATLVHELIGHPSEADVVKGGGSPVHAGPTPVTDSCVSVYDGCAGGTTWGAAPFDDEGSANPETLVIDRGHAHNVLSDHQHASADNGRPSTGNGRRQSYAHPVLPRVTRTRLAAGNTDPRELMARLGTGLWILSVEGAAINARSGRLTIDVKEARVIRGGTPGELVSRVSLTADAGHVLRGIEAVGNDPVSRPSICGKKGQWIPTEAQSPSILVNRLHAMGG